MYSPPPLPPTPSPECEDPGQPVLRNQFRKNLQRGMEKRKKRRRPTPAVVVSNWACCFG